MNIYIYSEYKEVILAVDECENFITTSFKPCLIAY